MLSKRLRTILVPFFLHQWVMLPIRKELKSKKEKKHNSQTDTQ